MFAMDLAVRNFLRLPITPPLRPFPSSTRGPASLCGPVVEAEQARKGNQMTVTNNDRAEWAAAGLRHFQIHTGTEFDDALPDLLCDLHHWCDRENVNFQSALERARQHYDAESVAPSPISYMATFNTPAGWVTEIFRTSSPEIALKAALAFIEHPNFSAEDVEPIPEGYCVREIVITHPDDPRHQLAVWRTDEYRVQLAAPKLLEALQDVLGDRPSVQGGICQHCGRDYISEFMEGDCDSDDCAGVKARIVIAQAKGGAA
jgi:hypothetical protein